MKNLLQQIIKKAQSNPKRIVFPETYDDRILYACSIIARKKIAMPILLGDEKKILSRMKTLGLSAKGTVIINHIKSEKQKYYAEKFYQIRKHKGMTLGEATKIMLRDEYFGTMMVHLGDADGLIAGAVHTTAETVRPALQIIKTKEKYHRVSGLFIMKLHDEFYLFADCSININPNSEELAQIGIDSMKTAKNFGIKPRVAFLSFSTHGSAKHENIDKVRKAAEIMSKKYPKAIVDGELQVDAAIVPFVAKIKCPQSKLKGRANVLIFPNVEAGNIAYKLVERLAKAQAVGPILQGLRKPVNDLSRGCSVEDIVNVAAITVVEAQNV